LTAPPFDPMLATPWPEPFDDDSWWFEVKWDGIRSLVDTRGATRIWSRRGRPIVSAYPEVAALGFPPDVVLDGELVAFDRAGIPSFQRLQRRMNLSGRAAAEAVEQVPVTLVAFDLLWDGGALLDHPIEQRRRRLAVLAPEGVVVPEPIAATGVAFYAAAVERGLEGVVAKRARSAYQPGRRSADWRKIVHRRSGRFVVGGYLPGEGARSASFGSLALGLWHEGALRFVGSVGSGFDDTALRLVREAIDQMIRPASPFGPDTTVPAGIRFIEPALVAVVEFREWTGDGHLRAPVFKGFTTDPVEEVTWDEEGPGP